MKSMKSMKYRKSSKSSKFRKSSGKKYSKRFSANAKRGGGKCPKCGKNDYNLSQDANGYYWSCRDCHYTKSQ